MFEFLRRNKKNKEEVTTDLGIVVKEDIENLPVVPNKNSEKMTKLIVSKDSELKRIDKTIKNIEILPENQTKQDIQNYYNTMVELKKPRLIREYGRPSNDIEIYAIPANYFPIESNTVNFNLSEGFFNPRGADDTTLKEANPTIFGKELRIFNAVQTNDLGTFLCQYLFNNGRKTIDELQKELTSYDPHLLTILVNKLKNDGFLQLWEETGEYYHQGELIEKKEAEVGLKTLELVTKETYFETHQSALESKEEEEEEGKENEKNDN